MHDENSLIQHVGEGQPAEDLPEELHHRRIVLGLYLWSPLCHERLLENVMSCPVVKCAFTS